MMGLAIQLIIGGAYGRVIATLIVDIDHDYRQWKQQKGKT